MVAGYEVPDERGPEASSGAETCGNRIWFWTFSPCAFAYSDETNAITRCIPAVILDVMNGVLTCRKL